MRCRLNWLEHEKNFLKENYGKILCKDISKFLKRSESSIRAKANELNLKSGFPQSKETREKINFANTHKINFDLNKKSLELSYVLGVLYGDGWVGNDEKKHRYNIKLGCIEEDFALKFREYLYKLFGLPVSLYKHMETFYKKRYMYFVQLSSKQAVKILVPYLFNHNEEGIKKLGELLNNEQRVINFIEGFFDSEGSIEKKWGRVTFTNTNFLLMEFLSEKLSDLGIIHKIYRKNPQRNFLRGRYIISKEIFNVTISHKLFIKKFCKIVNSSIFYKQKQILKQRKMRVWCKTDNTLSFQDKDFGLNPKTRIFLEEVITAEDKQVFKEFIKKYHSYKKEGNIVGKRINWLIKTTKRKNVVGVIGVSNSFLIQGTRDRFIGWNKEKRLKNIKKIANNWRFCFIREFYKNWASFIISSMIKKVKRRWFEKYGEKLVLIETYVEHGKRGTCYLASGWKFIGLTKGMEIKIVDGKRKCVGFNVPKLIFVKPLHRYWRKALTN